MAKSFTVAVGQTVASTLEGFLRGATPEEILRGIRNKPLLAKLLASKVEFGSAGTGQAGYTATGVTPAYIREPVLGALMRDIAGNYAGYSGDDELLFNSSGGDIQTLVPIRNMHSGFQITHDELRQQGVHITDGKMTYTEDSANILYDALGLKKGDWMEAIQFGRNNMAWLDGTQDAKAVPGIKSIITDDPTVGTCLGVARTNTWFRHIADTGVGGAGAKLVYSKSDQTLTERLETVVTRLLRTFGGNPDVCFAGGDLVDAVKREARAKGLLTESGWADSMTNIQVKGVKVGSLEIVWDPTLDLIGESKRIYIWDSSHLRLRPQKQEWGKVTNQNQPSNQFVMLISTTDTAALSCNQPDSCYVGEMA